MMLDGRTTVKEMTLIRVMTMMMRKMKRRKSLRMVLMKVTVIMTSDCCDTHRQLNKFSAYC